MPRSLGITSLQILGAIRRGVGYGLDIVTQTGMPSGTVYPTLGRLKKAELVKARWERTRAPFGRTAQAIARSPMLSSPTWVALGMRRPPRFSQRADAA